MSGHEHHHHHNHHHHQTVDTSTSEVVRTYIRAPPNRTACDCCCDLKKISTRKSVTDTSTSSCNSSYGRKTATKMPVGSHPPMIISSPLNITHVSLESHIQQPHSASHNVRVSCSRPSFRDLNLSCSSCSPSCCDHDPARAGGQAATRFNAAPGPQCATNINDEPPPPYSERPGSRRHSVSSCCSSSSTSTAGSNNSSTPSRAIKPTSGPTDTKKQHQRRH